MVGVESSSAQWVLPAARVMERAHEIARDGVSLAACISRCNMHCMSMLRFRSQFAAPTADIRRTVARTMQVITLAPWQAFASDLLLNLTVAGMPSECVDFDATSQAARAHTCMGSAELRARWEAFDVACRSVAAPLAALRSDILRAPVRRWHLQNSFSFGLRRHWEDTWRRLGVEEGLPPGQLRRESSTPPPGPVATPAFASQAESCYAARGGGPGRLRTRSRSPLIACATS